MHPLPLVALFFGGAFAMNAVPHTVRAAIGRPFPTPFARPPGRGLSSPTVNMAWGMANVAAAWLLLAEAGHLVIGDPVQAAAVGCGLLLTGLLLARHFGASDHGDGADAR